MERLIKNGTIIPKKSSEVKKSKIGLGFEKLDRDVFDPEKAYDKVAELGVKWIRIQSGWARCEKEKGVYDFEWLDSIVDNLTERGLIPWICLCYGNGIYDENAAKVFGAVGVPPIFNDEQKTAWRNYVTALVKRYAGKVTHFEVWNEPDGMHCWKHGVSATELGNFTIDTAKAVKAANKNAKVIGGVICCGSVAYLNEALKTGMGSYIDYLSFHEYTSNEGSVPERVNMMKSLADKYNKNIEIIQGESGSQSKSGGHGALRQGAWTEEKQAKQLARHMIIDILSNVYFTSYFSCMDMIEALNGSVDDVSSYLDYGYFGVLGAEFDEKGYSIGEYYKKHSYYVLQNISSVLAGDIESVKLPVCICPMEAERIFGTDLSREQLRYGGLRNAGGEALVLWHPSDIMTTSFEGTVSFNIYSEYDKVSVIDVMDGSIYEVPDCIMTRDEFGTYSFKNFPVKDTPLIVAFGNFYCS